MRKNIIFVGVSICLLVLLGVGLSYSMWNMSISQNTNNVIATTNECFDITLTNQSNTINLENAYPISDTKGKTLTPFTFTIKNTCQMAASYSVNLESLKGSTLSSGFIKVMVNDNNPKMLNSLESTDTVNTGSIESRVLDTGTIFKNKTKEYSIRLWIDYDTTLEDLNNEIRVLKSKITVKGVPSNEEEPLELLTDHITALSRTDTTNIATDDHDNNIRYIGANPSNYVYFNCSDYSNQTADTCEKWRIIGLFNNIAKGDGTKENLVKITRNERLNDSNFIWNAVNSDITFAINDWSKASLMQLLNPGYDTLSANNSIYYNGKSGLCYSSESDSEETTMCDFTNTGLKNNATRNSIANVIWNLGGISYAIGGGGAFDTATANVFYTAERGTEVYDGNATEWTGKIGLMYASDYGYATSGGTSISRTACLEKNLKEWNTENDCYLNSYLYKLNYINYTLTNTGESYPHMIYTISTSGGLVTNRANSHFSVHPTLYLKSLFTIKEGDGSENSPYQLNIE